MKYSRFEDFWLYYISQHSKFGTQCFHFFGLFTGFAFAGFTLLTGRYWWTIWSIPLAYSIVWFSHFFIEKNQPATFQYPLWSFISEFRLCGVFLKRLILRK